jgi:glyoxylase-like metal-dependent hydrolase (beta-lactamase superfamily II)
MIHPLGDALAVGESRTVAPGVQWLRIPIPFAPGHINVFALEDGDGWTLVDSGLRSAAAEAAWQAALATALAGRPVRRVIATHMHRDHAGMVGWLAERTGCALWMTRLEYLSCRLGRALAVADDSAAALACFRAAGWAPEALARYAARFAAFAEGLSPLPASYRRVEDGEVIRIGAHAWIAIVGRGHSPEHLCLHCPALGLLLAGDQVLPMISSNLSVVPMEPDARPVADWLDSLAMLRSRVDDGVLVLPAHDAPFRGLHARLDALAAHQHAVINRVRAALATPRRAVELCAVIYGHEIKDSVLELATGECLAYLNHLIAGDQVVRGTDADGVHWYRSVACASARIEELDQGRTVLPPSISEGGISHA